jgi:integrase/recombinase XerD
MSNSVAPIGRQHPQEAMTLYDRAGARKYVNQAERLRLIEASHSLAPSHELFVLTLAWTGARVSEVLALSPSSFQVESGVVSIQTLKRRRPIVRELPLPPALMSALDEHFGVRAAQFDPRLAAKRLWPWHRVTAWRVIKALMAQSRVFGRPASPRGLRHGFGVGAVQAGVPINLLQRWLGHARLATTAIYLDASGPEERSIADRFWRT